MRGSSSSISHPNIVDWTLSSADVIALSPWTIFGCQNGKCLFPFLLFELSLFCESCFKISLKYYSWIKMLLMFLWCNAGLRLFKEAKDRDSNGKVGRICFQ